MTKKSNTVGVMKLEPANVWNTCFGRYKYGLKCSAVLLQNTRLCCHKDNQTHFLYSLRQQNLILSWEGPQLSLSVFGGVNADSNSCRLFCSLAVSNCATIPSISDAKVG